jgi:hypothetical protein
MKQILLLITAGVVVAGCSTGYTVTLKQAGSNVVATGSGAINLTGLHFSGRSYARAGIWAEYGQIETGAVLVPEIDNYKDRVDNYLKIREVTGPASFGSRKGTLTSFANTGSGDMVGFAAQLGEAPGFNVPIGYMSGTLSSSATWNNATFDSLSVTPGKTYVWTWGAGANQNFTLIIEPFKWWRWLLPLRWRFPFPEWRSWPPPWPPPRDLPRPTSGDRELAK